MKQSAPQPALISILLFPQIILHFVFCITQTCKFKFLLCCNRTALNISYCLKSNTVRAGLWREADGGEARLVETGEIDRCEELGGACAPATVQLQLVDWTVVSNWNQSQCGLAGSRTWCSSDATQNRLD